MKVTEDQLKDIFVNPFYAVTFSESLFGMHTPMVTKEEWIRVNKQLIKDIGVDEWLTRLLDVIESGGVTREDVEE